MARHDRRSQPPLGMYRGRDWAGRGWFAPRPPDEEHGLVGPELPGRRPAPPRLRRPDARIEEDVRATLAASGLDLREVEFSVANGEVILSGRAQSRSARRELAARAEEVPGVIDVLNRLRVRQLF